MTAGGFMWAWTDPFYWSPETIASPAVPGEWDVGLNGYGYMIDWADEALVGPASIPLMRNQLDSSARPGEAALSRENLWRRSFTSFHHGAGQRWSDRDQSDQNRFRQSKGLDPWTPDRLTLLKAAETVAPGSHVTDVAWSLGNPLIPLLYWVDNGAVKAANLTDEAITGPFSILGATGSGLYNTFAMDGTYVYMIDGSTTNVWRTTAGLSTFSSFATTALTPEAIGYAHGRLIATNTNKFYDVSTGGATVATQTLSDTTQRFCAITEGTRVIFLASNSTVHRPSRIYAVTYNETTAALGAATSAATVPAGEVILTIHGYLGFVFVGTTRGFRMYRESSDGASLTSGPLVSAPGKVKSFAPIGQYVYFTWENYDASSSGLGRIDISAFTDADLVPAYASDVMATVAGLVPRVIAFDTRVSSDGSLPRPFFCIDRSGADSNGGVFRVHATDYVASGTMDLGLTAYGISEDKDIHAVDVRTEPLAGSVTVALAADEATPGTLDTVSQAGSSGAFMPALHVPASRAEVRLTLARGAATETPAVNAVTMYAWPGVHRGEMWVIPILLHEEIGNRFRPFPMQIWAEIARIRSWTIPGTAPVLLQIGDQTQLVKLIDYAPRPLKRTQDGSAFQCTVQLQIKDLDRKVAA